MRPQVPGFLFATVLMCVTAPALAQSADAELAPEHEYSTDHREPTAAPCALGHVCLGPVFTLGLPNLLGIGVHARVGEHIGFGVDYQYLPPFSFASISASSITLQARLYPLADDFFVSAGFAYQSVSSEGRATVLHPDDGSEVNLTGEGELGLPLLTLGVGWLGHHGPVIGIDLSIEVPLGSRKLTLRTAGSDGSEAFDDEIASLKRDIQDRADHILDLLPLVVQLNFLRLGYVF